MDQFIFTETLIVELLVIVSIVAIVVRRLRVPYTVALVISGLIISLEQPPRIALTPELILALFVPPLVFEAAFHLEWSRLRQNLGPILILAVPGVVLTTAVIGLIVSAGTGIALVSALVFGALISATDPVAVVALFRSLGMPSRLVTMVEGESLLNDGTAIVVFNIMVAAAVSEMTGNRAQSTDAASHVLTVLGVVVEFLRVSLGGVAIGVGLGLGVSWFISRIDDSLIETTLTTVLAFGAYLVAESLHISGVLAVVSAGIVCGNVGLSGMSPTTRLVLRNFWEYVAFVTNSLVFLLIGLEVNLYQLIQYAIPIGLAIVAVVFSRAVVIYGFSALLKLFRPHKHPGVSAAHQHVLFWGGLRGAVGLALALSLPSTFTDRTLLIVMAFGVVLFTLLVQGTTMNLLLRRLGLVEREPTILEYQRQHGRFASAQAALNRIEDLQRGGTLPVATSISLRTALQREIEIARDAEHDLLHQHPDLQAEVTNNARHEGLLAKRAALTTLADDGVISEVVYQELLAQVDAELEVKPEADPNS